MRARLPISASRLSSRLGARRHADHDDPPAGGERVQVVRHVGGAHQLEDHVERPLLGEALGRDRLGPERRDLGADSSRRTVAVTRAPLARASWIAAVPTPPAPPCTSRCSPGRSQPA